MNPTVMALSRNGKAKKALDAHMDSAHFRHVPRLREFSAKPGDGTLYKQI